MTPNEALRAILEISYAGHPEGRETRLEMIERYARAGLETAVEPDPTLLHPSKILARGDRAGVHDINRMVNVLLKQGQIEPLQVKRLTPAESTTHTFGTFSGDPWGNAILAAALHLEWPTVQVAVMRRYES